MFSTVSMLRSMKQDFVQARHDILQTTCILIITCFWGGDNALEVNFVI